MALCLAQDPPVEYAPFPGGPLGVGMLLFLESGFDPSSPGPAPDAANPVGGLNQMSLENLDTLGISRSAWLSLSAAQQLPVVFKFWQGLARTFAGAVFPSDGPGLLALNFLPASYQSSGAATNPYAVLAASAGPYAAEYAANVFYDPDKTGEITPLTIRRRFMLTDAANPPRWRALRANLAAAIARQSSSPSPASQAPPSRAGGGGGVVALLLAAGFVLWSRSKGWA